MLNEFTKKSQAKTWILLFQKAKKKGNIFLLFNHFDSKMVLIGMNNNFIIYPITPIMMSPIKQDFEI